MPQYIDSQAVTQDLRIDRGEALTIEATITNKATGAVVDLTGHTVEMLVHDDAGVEIVKLTNTSHEDAAAGETRFTLTDTVTRTASATSETVWDYAIHWKDDAAQEDIAVYGRIIVRAVPVADIA